MWVGLSRERLLPGAQRRVAPDAVLDFQAPAVVPERRWNPRPEMAWEPKGAQPVLEDE